MKLTAEAAKKLFDQGAFALIDGLPEGSEVGIDGDNHVIRKFSGFKMIPPGVHLISWITASSSASGSSSGLPIRKGMFHNFSSGKTLLLKYSQEREDLVPELTDALTDEILETTLGLDQLKSVDQMMAPYPFVHLPLWRNLTTAIGVQDVRRVLGAQGRVDGLSESPADEELQTRGENEIDKGHDEVAEKSSGDMKFCTFDLKRSWRKGAVGEEVTNYSRDKSWLFGDVVGNQFSNDPQRLLAELQLSFIIFLHLQNFSSLLAYKRILSLVARSTSTLLASSPSPPSSSITSFFRISILAISTQLSALPETFFTIDAAGTGLEDFWLSEIGELGKGLASSECEDRMIAQGYEGLKDVAARKFGWDLPSLQGVGVEGDDDDEEEDGEYAPVVVEM